jgi:hypothetical protein
MCVTSQFWEIDSNFTIIENEFGYGFSFMAWTGIQNWNPRWMFLARHGWVLYHVHHRPPITALHMCISDSLYIVKMTQGTHPEDGWTVLQNMSIQLQDLWHHNQDDCSSDMSGSVRYRKCVGLDIAVRSMQLNLCNY